MSLKIERADEREISESGGGVRKRRARGTIDVVMGTGGLNARLHHGFRHGGARELHQAHLFRRMRHLFLEVRRRCFRKFRLFAPQQAVRL